MSALLVRISVLRECILANHPPLRYNRRCAKKKLGIASSTVDAIAIARGRAIDCVERDWFDSRKSCDADDSSFRRQLARGRGVVVLCCDDIARCSYNMVELHVEIIS